MDCIQHCREYIRQSANFELELYSHRSVNIKQSRSLKLLIKVFSDPVSFSSFAVFPFSGYPFFPYSLILFLFFSFLRFPLHLFMFLASEAQEKPDQRFTSLPESPRFRHSSLFRCLQCQKHVCTSGLNFLRPRTISHRPLKFPRGSKNYSFQCTFLEENCLVASSRVVKTKSSICS